MPEDKFCALRVTRITSWSRKSYIIAMVVLRSEVSVYTCSIVHIYLLLYYIQAYLIANTLLKMSYAYPCLHPHCDFQAPTSEGLDLHIKAHFKGPQQAKHSFHPFVSLAALYAAANQQDGLFRKSYSNLADHGAAGATGLRLSLGS